MEYYGSNCFRNEIVRYENSAPYASDYYDCYPNYEYEAPKLLVWNGPSFDYDAYYLNQNRSEMAFSISSVSRPESVEFDLDNRYGSGYYPSKTNFVISYSTFNEDEDVEYDPTPYGGGYDIAQTYGNPLPPSDKICYPKSDISNSPVAPLALPNVNEIGDQSESEETKEGQKHEIYTIIEEDEGADDEENETDFETEADSMPLALPLDQENEGTLVDEQYPWTDYEYQNGRTEDYGYETENQFCRGETPRDYEQSSSDAMGFVESLFGWPCLSRFQEVEDENRNCNQVNGTADYFFGKASTYGYGVDEEASQVRTIYGYERHYPEEVEHKQFEYNGSSWFQEFNTYSEHETFK